MQEARVRTSEALTHGTKSRATQTSGSARDTPGHTPTGRQLGGARRLGSGEGRRGQGPHSMGLEVLAGPSDEALARAAHLWGELEVCGLHDTATQVHMAWAVFAPCKCMLPGKQWRPSCRGVWHKHQTAVKTQHYVNTSMCLLPGSRLSAWHKEQSCANLSRLNGHHPGQHEAAAGLWGLSLASRHMCVAGVFGQAEWHTTAARQGAANFRAVFRPPVDHKWCTPA